MASIWITEFRGVAVVPGGAANAPFGYLVTQKITVGSETDTAAFQTATKFVRVWTDTACHIRWGAAEQAATTTDGMPLGVGESFSFQVDGGDEISVIAA